MEYEIKLCVFLSINQLSLQWCHEKRDGVSNNQILDSFLNPLFRRRSKKTSNFRVPGPCERNPPVTERFPWQRASYAKNISIWWCHHVFENNVAIYIALISSLCLVYLRIMKTLINWVCSVGCCVCLLVMTIFQYASCDSDICKYVTFVN